MIDAVESHDRSDVVEIQVQQVQKPKLKKKTKKKAPKVEELKVIEPVTFNCLVEKMNLKHLKLFQRRRRPDYVNEFSKKVRLDQMSSKC